LRGNWQDFNWHDASRGPSAIAELLVLHIWRVLHLWGEKSKANGAYDSINHFACNFAKCSPILKILTPAKWTINLYWSNPSQLKCLALLSCDLSLSMHISYYRQFSDIYILLGSVATCLRCGWIFKYGFVANLLVSLSAKEFWKSVDIWGSYGQKFSVLFFDSRRSYQVNDLLCRKSLSTYAYCIDTHTDATEYCMWTTKVIDKFCRMSEIFNSKLRNWPRHGWVSYWFISRMRSASLRRLESTCAYRRWISVGSWSSTCINAVLLPAWLHRRQRRRGCRGSRPPVFWQVFYFFPFSGTSEYRKSLSFSSVMRPVYSF